MTMGGCGEKKRKEKEIKEKREVKKVQLFTFESFDALFRIVF